MYTTNGFVVTRNGEEIGPVHDRMEDASSYLHKRRDDDADFVYEGWISQRIADSTVWRIRRVRR